MFSLWSLIFFVLGMAVGALYRPVTEWFISKKAANKDAIAEFQAARDKLRARLKK